MLGKKILAGVFAVIVLLKLAFLLVAPGQWQGATTAFIGHQGAFLVIYLVVLVICGYYIFTSLDLIDVAVVMLFTSILIGLGLMPYSASLLKMVQEIGTVGLGKMWFAWIIWVAIAVAVLYRIFSSHTHRKY
ncbi:MAG: hypothetical protein M0P73_01825 [Syntrophobacterales bacterium]|jgi:hypothetical protein|nr:hypothetical protein [Syntrophobacterales bacterium]